MTPALTSRLSRFAWCAAALVLVACAPGRPLHDEAERALASGDHDAALAKLREASQKEPTNAQYKVDLLREQAAYARELIRRADDARRSGNADEASALYAKAVAVEPSNERAARGLAEIQRDAKHAKLLAEAERLLKDNQYEAARNKVKTVLTESPTQPAARKLLAAIVEQQDKAEQARAAQLAAQSIMRRPVTLQFRDANLRMVFEALSRTTGLNVILDRDVRADLKTTIFVKDASVEDTVDLILLQNQLEKRTLNANTLFVYPATPAKQKEYQDLQVRTFQVTNADVKYLQTVLKTVLKVKEVSVDERTNTLVIRDTPDAVAVATKVIQAHDVPDAEVMLEVEVLEVSRDRLSNLGLELPTSFTVATPSSAGTIGALRALKFNDLTASALSATANFQLQDTDANLLASPRIRARNKEKARILIGDRVPTITNTVTPVATGTPVVTGTVQYQEVGLKLEFEPQVYSDEEVGIKISLEVSSIAKEFTDSQGGRSYQIGTRNAQTSLRLRDGETQILGGLISDQDRNTSAKVPGLGHLPVVGALFGNNNGTRSKSELVLAITPRILRAPALADSAVRDIFSGTETSIRERALRLDPVGEVRSVSAPYAASPSPTGTASANTRPAAPATPNAPAASAPAALPAPVLSPPPAPANTSAAPAPPTVAAVAAPAATSRAEAAAPQPETLSAQPGDNGDLIWSGPASVRVGETFNLTLVASSLPPLQSLPVTVRFDPSVLRFVEMKPGPLAQDAGAEATTASLDASRGRVDVPMRFAKPQALGKDGTLVTLVFQVVAGRAQTQVIASQVEGRGSDGSSHMLPGSPRSHSLRITR